jgi:UDP-glucuronate 4-epimerase
MSTEKEKENAAVRILVTGAAGFIGFHFVKRLLEEGFPVTAIDNFNHYYDVNLKAARLQELGFTKEKARKITAAAAVDAYSPGNSSPLVLYKADLKDKKDVDRIFEAVKPGYVVHLAAQAGVRYSLENPYAYIDSNILGFMNILENCRRQHVKHLVFSSSSSVYGANESIPFTEQQNVDHPVSLYAATKKSNELMAHSYAHLYNIPVTGLRFFTVYGPWGRPDMAYFKFAQKIVKGEPIEVYNHGDMKRDFTYIDDIVEGMMRVMKEIPAGNPAWNGKKPDPATSRAPYRIFNIGNNQPVDLLYFIQLLEQNLGKKAVKKFLPFQDGDVKDTCANIDALNKRVGFKPSTPFETGIKRFVEWFKGFKGINGTKK